MALPDVQRILDRAAEHQRAPDRRHTAERRRELAAAHPDAEPDEPPAVGWPDKLLMALIEAHPERIPEGLLDYLNRGRVNRSSLDPDERSAG